MENTIKPLVVASNMLNEKPQLQRWFEFVRQIADGGILIVDGKSTDGTQEFCRNQGAIVVEDDIIQREGYGPARNHLRELSREHFSNAHWMMYLDADETIDEREFHTLRFLKDYLVEDFDVIVFPRIDWHDETKTKAENDWKIAPDWQARMTRLHEPIFYIRRCHEQIKGYKAIYANLTTPKINHFHRSTSQEKRDLVGKLCAKLHSEDEYGDTYPKHHKEEYYLDLYKKEGL